MQLGECELPLFCSTVLLLCGAVHSFGLTCIALQSVACLCAYANAPSQLLVYQELQSTLSHWAAHCGKFCLLNSCHAFAVFSVILKCVYFCFLSLSHLAIYT